MVTLSVETFRFKNLHAVEFAKVIMALTRSEIFFVLTNVFSKNLFRFRLFKDSYCYQDRICLFVVTCEEHGLMSVTFSLKFASLIGYYKSTSLLW